MASARFRREMQSRQVICTAPGPERRAERSSFADDIPRFLVLTQANAFRMPQMVVAGPLKELELADNDRLQPLTFRHLRLGQALTPSAASRPREVGERTFADLESFEPPEQLGTCRRREPV